MGQQTGLRKEQRVAKSGGKATTRAFNACPPFLPSLPSSWYCSIYDSSPAQDLAGPIYVFSSSMKRNKRCLLAYHNRRCEVIEKLRWEHGASIPQAMRSKLCASEQDYFQIYNEILTSYMEGVGIMLTSVSGGGRNGGGGGGGDCLLVTA